MTNPVWCPACEEERPDQPDDICSTCGEDLQQPPSSSNHPHAHNSAAIPHESDRLGALLASSIQNNGIDASTIFPIVNQLRSDNTANIQGADISDIASLLPPEALNPQAGASSQRPVSKLVLDGLKRVVLTNQSAELFDAQIIIFNDRSVNDVSPCMTDDECLRLCAVPGEFLCGPSTDPRNKTAALVLCSPRTTKGGLSSNTKEEISILRQHRMPFIAYVERGDGITFVQKALVCQRAGEVDNGKSLCIGVIIGNAGTAKEVWPYAMQDTKKEAEQFGLNIPVVMIRREDGNKLVQRAGKRPDPERSFEYTPCRIHVNSKEDHSCPVCAECYVAGATIVRLPTCGHVFHEQCALMWLTKHK